MNYDGWDEIETLYIQYFFLYYIYYICYVLFIWSSWYQLAMCWQLCALLDWFYLKSPNVYCNILDHLEPLQWHAYCVNADISACLHSIIPTHCHCTSVYFWSGTSGLATLALKCPTWLAPLYLYALTHSPPIVPLATTHPTCRHGTNEHFHITLVPSMAEFF